MFTIGPTQDQKHVRMVFKGTSIRSVANSYLCRQSIKKTCKWGYDCITKFTKSKPETRQPKVGKFEYLVMPIGKGKCHFQHAPSHQE